MRLNPDSNKCALLQLAFGQRRARASLPPRRSNHIGEFGAQAQGKTPKQVTAIHSRHTLLIGKSTYLR